MTNLKPSSAFLFCKLRVPGSLAQSGETKGSKALGMCDACFIPCTFLFWGGVHRETNRNPSMEWPPNRATSRIALSFRPPARTIPLRPLHPLSCGIETRAQNYCDQPLGENFNRIWTPQNGFGLPSKSQQMGYPHIFTGWTLW